MSIRDITRRSTALLRAAPIFGAHHPAPSTTRRVHAWAFCRIAGTLLPRGPGEAPPDGPRLRAQRLGLDAAVTRRTVRRAAVAGGGLLAGDVAMVATGLATVPATLDFAHIHLSAQQKRALRAALGAVPVVLGPIGLACLAPALPRLVAHRWYPWLDRRPFAATRWLFLRALGGIYLAAFGSLWPQLPGLIGRNGIAPAAEYLEAVKASLGRDAYWRVPTLAWLDSSDRGLHLICGSGLLLSALLIVGVWPVPVLVLLWASYLSLVSIGQDFLSFQWDALLLESGFLSIFFAPAQILPGRARETAPSRAVLWLLRWLVFRLMFLSGLVKLTSGDPTWRGLAALTYHYETQPLPTPVAWYAHQLPRWFHRLSVAATFVIEIGVPFLIFGPRIARLASAALLVWLQLLIVVTGNYAFFNLLSIALCLTLLDDDALARVAPGARAWLMPAATPRPVPLYRRLLVLPPLAAVLVLSTVHLADLLPIGRRLPRRARRLAERAAPWHVANRYGLFAVMTTSRPEIVVEGSRDGQTWVAYEFRYKPGDVRRPPPWVAPHQPRLDWQMWFAALGGPWSGRWFRSFMAHLLHGTPEVLALLGRNPFPSDPPRYVRALLYDYRFTNWEARAADGAWWRRELQGLYYPAVSMPPA